MPKLQAERKPQGPRDQSYRTVLPLVGCQTEALGSFQYRKETLWECASENLLYLYGNSAPQLPKLRKPNDPRKEGRG